jgi:dTMP kinase
MKQGRFITFEGPEGCGKSTQIELLSDRLAAQGIPVLKTREPGGTATGEQIRGLLQHDAAGEPLAERAELLLFTASRAQLMDRMVLPSLERGEWVLCDRFMDSTMAYQAYARGMEIGLLDRINDFAVYGRKPDLTLLLDLEVECGLQRLQERYAGGNGMHDRFEREALEFHRRVRAGYHQLTEREPERFRVIDSDRPIGAVAADVWKAVKGALL